MKYLEARPQIRNGDLLAWRGNALFSRIIQIFSRDKYSHVGIAIWLDKELFVYEAREFRGVRLERLSVTTPFYWVDLGGKWTAEARLFAHTQLNRRYSWGDIVRIALGVRLDPSDGRWICSEIAREVMRLNQHAIGPGYETPSQLMDWCDQEDFSIRLVETET